MIAELLLLQKVLVVTNDNVKPSNTNALDKAKSTAEDYRNKLTSYLQRFRYRRYCGQNG